MEPNYQELIAKLESQIDLIETELCYLNEMLLKCGFSEGIHSLKRSMEDYLSNSSFHEN